MFLLSCDLGDKLCASVKVLDHIYVDMFIVVLVPGFPLSLETQFHLREGTGVLVYTERTETKPSCRIKVILVVGLETILVCLGTVVDLSLIHTSHA